MSTSIHSENKRNRDYGRRQSRGRTLLAGLLLPGLLGTAALPMQVLAEGPEMATEAVTETGEALVTATPDAVDTTAENENNADAGNAAGGAAGDAADSSVDDAVDGTAEDIVIENAASSGEGAEEEPVGLTLQSGASAEAGTDVQAEAEENASDEVIIAQDGAGPDQEKIYSVDPFDAAYSSGYFCIQDSYGHGLTYVEGGSGWPGWHGTNTKRSENIYVDHYKGACMNGTYYDIREYTWGADMNYYSIWRNDGNGAEGKQSARMCREFHFYEAGTLGSDHPVEVTFRGVMMLDDLDINEGYTFDQGLVGAWLNETTRVRRIDERTWKGTVENDNSEYAVKRLDALWVEIEGTPEQPLTFTYWASAIHASQINYYGSSVTYELVADGVHALPKGAEPSVGTHCATYAQYSLMPEESFPHYEFDGWYYDADLTEKVPDTIMVSEDHTFYGTYHQVAGVIRTEVVNGTITEGNDDVPFGTDMRIAYAPDEGCFLTSVTVDGEPVSLGDCKDQYLFSNIQDDHTIRVVYAEGAEPVKVVSDENGRNIDGNLVKVGDVLTYTITCSNPAENAMTVTATDEIPENTTFAGSVPAIQPQNGQLVWTQEVPSGETMTCMFRVRVESSAQGTTIRNKAAMQIGGMTYETQEVTNPVEAAQVVVASTTTRNNKSETNKEVTNETVVNRTITNETVNNRVETPVVVSQPEAVVTSPGPATGDDSAMLLYLGIAASAGAVLAVWALRRYRLSVGHGA